MTRSARALFSLLFFLLAACPYFRAHAEQEATNVNALRPQGPILGNPRVAQRERIDLRRGGDEADEVFSRISNPLRSVGEAKELQPESSVDAKPILSTETKPEESELSAEMKALRYKLRRCLAHYYQQHERISEHSPWGIMHALIAFGVDTKVYAGNKKVNAIGWLCYFNGSCRGQRLFYVSNGKLQVRQGPGVQGHDGQFLAMLAQSRVRSDYPIKVGGKKFTIADLVEHEKLTCEAGTELTFKLIGLMHYLDSDATWKNSRGQEWNLERLIKEELAQPVIGAACGGTHRMMGFSHAVKLREQRGEPFTGQWLRTKKFVDAYHKYTLRMQNEDGSFSTNFFKGRGHWGDNALRLETTGHVLEWLVYSLPEDELQDPRVIKAVNYLADLMWDYRRTDWEIGPKGHALHALALYDQRVFDAQVGQGGPQIISSDKPAEEN